MGHVLVGGLAAKAIAEMSELKHALLLLSLDAEGLQLLDKRYPVQEILL